MIRFKSFTYSSQAVLFLTIILVATFSPACSFIKQKSFEGEIVSKMFIGNPPSETRYAIKGTRMRMEQQMSFPSFSLNGPQTTVTKTTITVIDSSTGAVTMIDPDEKTYMTLNADGKADEIAKEIENSPDFTFPKVTSTGETETIAGVKCTHWKIGDETDMCIAQGMGYFGGGGGGILDNLKNLGKRSKIKVDPEFAEFVEDGAFPLKMSNIKGGQSTTIMEVTSIERKSLDDSIFAVPAGYKKTDAPSIPGMPKLMR
jgi:Domain of unknown function (DUF4412)